MADISKIKTRSNGTEYNIKDASAFRTGDTADTTIDNADTIPFYDTSATAKKKITVANLKTAIGGSASLVDLTDTNITNPSDGQVLQYDATSQKWVNVIAGGVIPDGQTVLPVGDIATWLHCANIFDKNYTALSQVLADATTLLALISNGNAVHYMLRSTTWATDVCNNALAMTDIGANNYCADTLLTDSTWRMAICNSTYMESVLPIKVPTMTSNTTPSGVASCSKIYAQQYQPYMAFDGSDATYLSISAENNIWFVAYEFTSDVKVNAFKYRANTNASALTFLLGFTLYVDGSNDGTTWTPLYNKTLTADEHKACVTTPLFEGISNGNKYRKYRIRSNTANYNYNSLFSFTSLQFYGRA